MSGHQHFSKKMDGKVRMGMSVKGNTQRKLSGGKQAKRKENRSVHSGFLKSAFEACIFYGMFSIYF